MRARHRTSKLLLRQGIVWSGGTAWTGAHEAWLRTQTFDHVGLTIAYDTSLEAVLLAQTRRDRRGPVAVPARGLHVDRGRAGGGGRGLAPVHRQHHRLVPGPGAHRALLRRVPQSGLDHQDRQHPRPPAAGGGRVAPPPSLPHAEQGPAGPLGSGTPAARARGHEGNRRLHRRWEAFTERKKRTTVANVAVARELAGWCWSLAVMDTGMDTAG